MRCKCNVPTVFDERRGEEICPMCGLIVSVNNIGTSHDDYTRGKPLLLSNYDGHLTAIGMFRGDLTDYKNNVIRKNREMFDRISRIYLYSSKSERARIHVNRYLAALERLNLSKEIIKEIEDCYVRLYTAKPYQRTIAQRLAAITYLICRKRRVVRSIKEIASAFGVIPSQITGMVFYLIKNDRLRLLKVSLDDSNNTDSIYSYSVEEYISQMVNRLGLSEQTKREAIAIYRRAKVASNDFAGMSIRPKSLAVGCIYYVCKHNKGKDKRIYLYDIVEELDITKETIARVYNIIRDVLSHQE